MGRVILQLTKRRALWGNYFMAFQGDSIFWVDTDKVVPNPFQPRREFDQSKLQELADSIRMYGVLQPLTVTRTEVQNDNGTFYTQYELIAGERRLRASKLSGVAQVPVIIREGEQSEQEKLELAIIENLQREDLNAIDRALAFSQLAEQFELSHTEVAKKVQRSREYVSNSIRLLALPEHIQGALQRGELGEGHARTLLMLTDKPEEQETIFREILLKKMSVREVERIVRKIATDKVRKKNHTDIGDHLIEIEKEFTETLGTRVQIQKTEFGGKLTIDYFSEEDLSAILKRMKDEAGARPQTHVQKMAAVAAATPLETVVEVPARSYEQRDVQNEDVPVVSSVVNQTPVHVPEPTNEIPAHPTSPVSQPEQVSVPTVVTGSVVPEVSNEVAAAPTPAPVEAPQADPGLLAKLAAHTAFGFSRPQPAHQPEVVETTPEPVQQPETRVAPAAPIPAPEQPAVEPQTEKPSESDSDDMYSLRNFSI